MSRIHARSRLGRFLRYPLVYTKDIRKAEASRYQWRQEGDGYVLSLLGILHTMVGLTVWEEADEDA